MSVITQKKQLDDWLKFEQDARISRKEVELGATILAGIAAAPEFDLTGAPVGIVTATGKYELWDSAKNDGTQTIKGLLMVLPNAVTGARAVVLHRDAKVILKPLVDESLIASGSVAAVTTALAALGIDVAKAV